MLVMEWLNWEELWECVAELELEAEEATEVARCEAELEEKVCEDGVSGGSFRKVNSGCGMVMENVGRAGVAEGDWDKEEDDWGGGKTDEE